MGPARRVSNRKKWNIGGIGPFSLTKAVEDTKRIHLYKERRGTFIAAVGMENKKCPTLLSTSKPGVQLGGDAEWENMLKDDTLPVELVGKESVAGDA